MHPADPQAALAGTEPGGVRRLRARWVLTAKLEGVTAVHLGGGDDPRVDMPVLRAGAGIPLGPHTGAAFAEDPPLLTGASLAGALRDHLLDRLAGFGAPDPGVRGAGSAEQAFADAARLFGARRAIREEEGMAPGSQSALIVFDSVGHLDDYGTEVRDGVSIDGGTGTAKPTGLYDFELIPPGTAFPLRFDLLVADTDGAGRAEDEERLLSLLCAACEGLASGQIRLGARTSRGFGEVVARSWRARRFDLRTEEGWTSWLRSNHDLRLDGVGSHRSPSAAVAAAHAQAGLPSPLTPDLRRRLTCDVKVRFAGGVLVAAAATGPADPDAVQVSSGGKPVLPGTSQAGALRAHALAIARVVRKDRGDAEQWVRRMFGTAPASGEKGGSASRLRVFEREIEGGVGRAQTRIRLDRLTQGVMPGGTFDDEPIAGGTVELRLELRDPQPGEAGLLLLLVKDLLTGELPVGGTASVGRGAASGTAMLRAHGPRMEKFPPLELDPQARDESASELIEELRSALALPAGDAEGAR